MTWCCRLALVAAAVAIGGCASNGAFPSDATSGGTGGEGTSDGAAVAFSEGSPLSVAPGQEVRLSVQTDPPGAYQVSFLLLGDSLDASLDRSSSPTDASGAAEVTLLAPSKAASFAVRAAVGEPSHVEAGAAGEAELVIQVTDIGLGQLRIIPHYQGNREITTWRAAVVPQAQCEDFAPPDDPDDAEIVEGAAGEELVLDDAIVGPNLAVLVRSEQKVWGCAETSLSHAGESKELTVPVLDRALDLSTAALDLSLVLDAPPAALDEVLGGADAHLLAAALPADEGVASLLLDAVALRIPAEVADELQQARETLGLDAEVGDDFAARDVDVRAFVAELLAAGRPLAPLFLQGRLSSAEADATHALLRVETFAGVDASLAGVPPEHLLSFAANPGDTVVIGAESGVFFFPTRLVGALAEKAALAGAPAGTTFATVLASGVGCLDLAYVVGPLGDCDVACVEASCRLALGDLWELGLDASARDVEVGVFTVVVSGQGVVDDDAALVALDPASSNAWVGELRAVGRSANLGGTAVALEADDEDDGDAEGGFGDAEP